MENPEYARWMAQDQAVLAYLLNSLMKEILTQVAMLDTSAKVWATIIDMFSSQSRARVTNLCITLANSQKGSMTTTAYFSKMKALADDLASAGKPIEDEELVSYILAGLDIDYNPLVSSICSCTEPISVSHLYLQIQSYDNRMEMLHGSGNGGQFQSSANAASRGRGSTRGKTPYRSRGGNNGGHGRGSPNNGGRGGQKGGQNPQTN